MSLRRKLSWSIAGVIGLALGLGVLMLFEGGGHRPKPRIGQSFEEFRSLYMNAEIGAAERRRLPPFRKVQFGGTGDEIELTVRYYFRQDHFFLTHYVHFGFTNGTFTGISMSYRQWRLNL